MSKPKLHSFSLKPTKFIPNSRFPLLHYESAFPKSVTAEDISERFSQNKWVPQWQAGMYYESHYHSTTHEALGVFRGSAKLRFGVSDKEEANDSNSLVLNVEVGDVIVIPSGVAHRALEDKDGFKMVGAYPEGAKQWDMNYGGEDKEVDNSVPAFDPVYGLSSEGLRELWK